MLVSKQARATRTCFTIYERTLASASYSEWGLNRMLIGGWLSWVNIHEPPVVFFYLTGVLLHCLMFSMIHPRMPISLSCAVSFPNSWRSPLSWILFQEHFVVLHGPDQNILLASPMPTWWKFRLWCVFMSQPLVVLLPFHECLWPSQTRWIIDTPPKSFHACPFVQASPCLEWQPPTSFQSTHPSTLSYQFSFHLTHPQRFSQLLVCIISQIPMKHCSPYSHLVLCQMGSCPGRVPYFFSSWRN